MELKDYEDQEELIRILGVGKTTFSCWLSGVHLPQKRFREQLKAYGITFNIEEKYPYYTRKEPRDDFELGKKLKEKNMSQAELARRMGLSRQQIHAWVQGKNNPNTESRDTITAALHNVTSVRR